DQRLDIDAAQHLGADRLPGRFLLDSDELGPALDEGDEALDIAGRDRDHLVDVVDERRDPVGQDRPDDDDRDDVAHGLRHGGPDHRDAVEGVHKPEHDVDHEHRGDYRHDDAAADMQDPSDHQRERDAVDQVAVGFLHWRLKLRNPNRAAGSGSITTK